MNLRFAFAYGRARPRFGLHPFADLEKVEDASGLEVYDARGSDPRMLWRPSPDDERDLRLQGAVRVRVLVRALEGRLREPCVYFDWGDGFSEETRRPLRHSADGWRVAVGHTNAGSCVGVRFDPSSGPCRFELVSFVVEGSGSPRLNLEKIGRVRRMGRRILRRLPPPVQRIARGLKRGVVNREPLRASLVNAARRGRSGRGSHIWHETYTHSLNVARALRSPFFAAPPLEPPRRDPEAAIIVAFYLPQFHPVPENDAWWGRGFTEWANVAKAVPQFFEHYQPRLPADFGYYDLRLSQVQKDQVDLARNVGVNAFCFHYYRFAGRRILERPLDAFVADEKLDFPFALCWANENWTRRWDGAESEILLAQNHTPEDDLAVAADLIAYMRSPRYLRVGGRPLLVVYRPDTLPDPAGTLIRWRMAAREAGLGELFLLCTDAFGFSEYQQYGFDGIVEFPPHALSIGEITSEVQVMNPDFHGTVYDYAAVVEEKEEELQEVADPRRFPGLMTAWDNTARSTDRGNVFHNALPDSFYRWSRAALSSIARRAPPAERLVFVNAWNEWAEGTYLEPDKWLGHGFAQALRTAISETAPRLEAATQTTDFFSEGHRHRECLCIVHIYYPEMIGVVAERSRALRDLADTVITFPDHWGADEVQLLRARFPGAALRPRPNRGRDVEPFLAVLREALSCGYILFCKIHTKRSPHLHGGQEYRDYLFQSLVSPEAVELAFGLFAEDETLGLLAPSQALRHLGEPGVSHHNKANLERVAAALNVKLSEATGFAAGTMFWGRLAAFRALAGPDLAGLEFETEMGRIDGTLAHALERVMGAVVSAAGYQDRYTL